jgi:hypothetical protein
VKRRPRSKAARAPVRPGASRRRAARTRAPRPAAADAALRAVHAQIARVGDGGPARWNADPEDVRRSVARLVLTLVEFLRELLERQAIRRMEARSLTPRQTEDLGLALMRLEETVREIAAQFDLDPAELNLDLGPVARLR